MGSGEAGLARKAVAISMKTGEEPGPDVDGHREVASTRLARVTRRWYSEQQ